MNDDVFTARKALPPKGGKGKGGVEVVPPVPDVIQEARDTVRAVMQGRGGRNAMARLLAAKAVLAKDFLEHVSDDDLIAEVKRRTNQKKLTDGEGGADAD